MILGIILEVAWYVFVRESAYPWKETLASFGVFVFRIPARFASTVIVGSLLLFVWSLRPVTIPLDNIWTIMLLFLAVEFAYYWMHRADHMIRWMWASHVVHHTPEHLHFASAFRLSATEFISGSWLFILPLPLIGFHPAAVGAMLALNLFYQFWLHTEAVGRLGPLEWIFNTPSHHRVHHASNEGYRDRNFGGILIIWDRLFGTFTKEPERTIIKYGLVEPIGSLNPLKLLLHEWHAMAVDVCKASDWRDGLKQLFGRPKKRGTPKPESRNFDGFIAQH
jgi:sterol desaturase/sphingolipid hydroxylase (fatty acid hydroxylase superfamily)